MKYEGTKGWEYVLGTWLYQLRSLRSNQSVIANYHCNSININAATGEK
jgi:hypothetical protein